MNRSILFTAITSVILVTACDKDDDKDPPVASFNINPESTEVGVTVNFQSTCQNATAFEWNFDDGSNSTEENPSHVYTAGGSYLVRLKASNEDGSDEASKSIVITPSSPCWTRLADLPEARSHHVAAAVNDRIYVMGGNGMSDVEEYDPSTDTWTKKTDIPTPRQAASGCVINGKIYVIGGVSGAFTPVTHFTVEVYDPVSDTWTEKTPMPTARVNHASVAFDGKIYVIGGHIGWDDAELYNTIEVYDPETDEWTTQVPPQSGEFFPRWGLSACTLNGKIYAIGGSNAVTRPVTSLKTVQEYDPIANTWKNKSNMPTARFFASIALVNERIYMIGGAPAEAQVFQTVEEFDPLNNTWETKNSMPVGMSRLAAGELDQLIYVSGGIDENHDDYSYFYVYDPSCDTN